MDAFFIRIAFWRQKHWYWKLKLVHTYKQDIDYKDEMRHRNLKDARKSSSNQQTKDQGR